ncbi:uncharacterized protein [Euphorbia lathyris]|uniref:uncharacterized protein n=1 Tax=Euphorbia lathyris TaxID=212925 RepID=UPI0033134E71
MAGRSQFGAVEEDIDDLTATELVISSKSAVQNAEEAAEDKLMRELEGKTKENELLRKKIEFELLEKWRLEEESEALVALSSSIRVQREELRDVLEMSQTEFTDLRKEICELKYEKLRNKTEADIYESRIEELKVKVVCLENNLEMARSRKNPKAVNMEIETRAGKINVSEDFVKSEEDANTSDGYISEDFVESEEDANTSDGYISEDFGESEEDANSSDGPSQKRIGKRNTSEENANPSDASVETTTKTNAGKRNLSEDFVGSEEDANPTVGSPKRKRTDIGRNDESDELVSSGGNGKRVKTEEQKPSLVEHFETSSDDDSSSSSHAIEK